MFRFVRWSPLVLLLALVACGQDGGGGGAAPQITSFTANPVTTAAPGDSAQLSWVISGTPTSLVIDNGVGTVTGNSVTVNPTTTTTYKLTASNSSGSDDATATVTVGGGSSGAPTGSFGVSTSSTGPFQNDAGGGIVDASDSRIVRVQPNSTIYFQATYTDPDGIASVVPYLGNDNVDTPLTPGTSVYGFTASAPTGCTLGASQTSVTCLFTVQVGNIPNISDVAEFAGEFAYVFKVNVTDGAGTAAADSTRGYVIVGSGSDPTDPTTTDPTDPTDPTDSTDPTDPTSPATTYTLTVVPSMLGAVTSNPTGISCPDTCTKTYTEDSTVTLTATPVMGYAFDSWGGSCSGATCALTMNANKTVTVNFVPTAPEVLNADAGADTTGTVGTPVTLDGSKTTGATTYIWTLLTPGMESGVVDNATEEVASFTPDAPGKYVATLTAGDGTTTDNDEVTITVSASMSNQPQ